jgi:hypothetical protein
MNIYRHEDDYDVHNTHCCKCGCKYGDYDCPVEFGDAEGVKCEDCEYEDESLDAEIDSFFDRFDSLFKKGDFERADKIIDEFLKRDLQLKIAMLTATLPASSKLKSRDKLYRAVLNGPYNNIDAILRGLK